jgi:hypothetical protein
VFQERLAHNKGLKHLLMLPGRTAEQDVWLNLRTLAEVQRKLSACIRLKHALDSSVTVQFEL